MAALRNLVIVLASGLRSDALDDERVWPLKTPHFRKLAQDAVRLVATSACPTEPGGLVSLLTGLHARQHGCASPDEAPPCLIGLPMWLADAGYHVAGVGSLGPFAATCTQSVAVGSLNDPQPRHCDYFRHAMAEGIGPAIATQRRRRTRYGPFDPDRLLLTPETDVDGFIASEARRMLEAMPPDAPWALIVAFTGPGNDLPPPPPYDTMVDASILADGFRPADLKRLDALAEPAYPRIQLQRMDPGRLARIRADYLGRVGLIDRGLGELIDVVARRPDHPRTWTVVASDAGYLLGEHGLIGRRSFLAGAVETPIILAGPPTPGMAARAGHEDAGLFSTVDAAATIAALGGADLPRAAAGRSLLALWTGESLPPFRGGIISEFNDRVLLETERHKAVFSTRTGQCLGVFDLLNDPDEHRNLSEAAVGRNLVDSLRLRLADALLPLRAPVR